MEYVNMKQETINKFVIIMSQNKWTSKMSEPIYGMQKPWEYIVVDQMVKGECPNCSASFILLL